MFKVETIECVATHYEETSKPLTSLRRPLKFCKPRDHSKGTSVRGWGGCVKNPNNIYNALFPNWKQMGRGIRNVTIIVQTYFVNAHYKNDLIHGQVKTITLNETISLCEEGRTQYISCTHLYPRTHTEIHSTLTQGREGWWGCEKRCVGSVLYLHLLFTTRFELVICQY